jgi:ribosomal protein S6
MESATRPYEISFLVRAEEDVPALAALLSEHGAQVTDEGQVRKLALAYPVKKVTEGYFGYLVATMDPESAKKLENSARTFPQVLRLLVLSSEPAKAPKASAVKKAARRERAAAPAAVSNEDLAKELEKLTADAS